MKASLIVPAGYLLLLAVVVYGVWGAAYVRLGRPPQRGFDHPYFFSDFILLAGVLAQWLLGFGLMMAVLSGFIWYAAGCEYRWLKRQWQMACLCAIGALVLVCIACVLLDIGGAMSWIVSL